MFISFGQLTKKSLLFLFLPIVWLIRIILIQLSGEDRDLFYKGFLVFLGKSFHGILWSILEKATESTKKEKKDNKDTKFIINNESVSSRNNSELLDENESKDSFSFSTQYELNYYEKRKKEKKNNLKNNFILILSCILNFFHLTYSMIKYKTKYYQQRSNGLISLDVAAALFAFALFSHFILKNSKMYRHHYLSAIIMLIVVITTNIFSLITKEKFNENYFTKMGFLILSRLLFSLAYVCGTKYLYISKGNIYQLLFFEGIIGIILSILLQIVVLFTIPCNSIKDIFPENKEKNYCDNINRLNTMFKTFDSDIFKITTSVLLIIVHFLENWLIWLLIYNYSVNHFGAIWSISSLSFLGFDINKLEIKSYTVSILGCVIIIFTAFVYNEIIILKFCGLDKNTVTEINRRSLRDSRCDFGKEEDAISVDSNGNYLNFQDGEVISDENNKKSELSNY